VACLQVDWDVVLQHPEVGSCHECVEGIVFFEAWAAPGCSGTQVGTCTMTARQDSRVGQQEKSSCTTETRLSLSACYAVSDMWDQGDLVSGQEADSIGRNARPVLFRSAMAHKGKQQGWASMSNKA
jgi:hypothetical protein